jgi:hypothetical protein
MCIVIKSNYFILGLVVLILLIGHSDSFAQDVVGENGLCVYFIKQILTEYCKWDGRSASPIYLVQGE